MGSFPRWMKVALALAVLATVAGGAWFYRSQEHQLRRQVEDQLAAIARLKVKQITDWRANQLAEGREVMESQVFTESLARYLANPQGEATEPILIHFRGLQHHYDYRDVLLLSPDGRVRLSLSGASGAAEGETLIALAAALRLREPALTDLYTSRIDPAPHVTLVTPVLASDRGVRRPLGMVMCVSDAYQFLYPLIQSWPTPSSTAETLLVRRDGEDALFLNELRHQSNAALSLRIPLTQVDVPAVMAVLGKEGVVAGTDYRGVKVLSAFLRIPDSPWFIVAKVDANEAFANWRSRSLLILSLILGLVTLVGAAVLVVWQRNQKAHYRMLFQSEASRRAGEERYGITLRSIGDAVIATDALGRIELINPVAETLTGWNQAEALGKPLAEVFRIVCEDSGLLMEDPVARVLREDSALGMSNNARLIARDGTARIIADAGAPIRDEQGVTTGVVLVFRDQTEERRIQREQRRIEAERELLATAIAQAAEVVFITDAQGTIQYANPAFEAVTGYTREEAIGRNPRLLKSDRHDEAFYRDLWQTITSGKMWQGRIVNRKKDGTDYVEEMTISPVRDEAGTIVNFVAVKREITREISLEAQLLQAQKMESVGRLAGGVAHDFNNMLGVILGYTELARVEVRESEPLYADLEEIRKAALRSADLTRQLLTFARKQTVLPKVLDLNDSVEGMLRMLRRLIGEDTDLVWIPGPDVWPVKIDPSQVDQVLANLVVNSKDAITGLGKLTIETENIVFDETYCDLHAGFVPGAYVMLAVSDNGRGIEKETLDHIFEPFFTTKGPGQGTGLGLAMVYGIVKQNDGFINVYSEPGKGTTFKIYLPRYTGTASLTDSELPEESVRGGSETLLVVEDEEAILELDKMMLEQLGYTVLIARTPGEALHLVKEHPEEIHLLITDVVMPEMNGRELSERLAEARPGVKCLFTSGYTANVIAHRGVLEEGVHFLPKPFSVRDLAATVREVLDQQPAGGTAAEQQTPDPGEEG